MDAIFVNSKNSKTSDPNRSWLLKYSSYLDINYLGYYIYICNIYNYI